ncbi:hypothetical protein QY97_03770 [Bacillus thermotolerans]|nr:hypothetical protein QY97_03770 [Bacillus thermotolerans]
MPTEREKDKRKTARFQLKIKQFIENILNIMYDSFKIDSNESKLIRLDGSYFSNPVM